MSDLRRTRVISWSEISDMRQCPHKHDLSYRQRWSPVEPARALVVGTLWHKVLEEHYRALQAIQALHGYPSPLSEDETAHLVNQAVKGLLFPPAEEDDEAHDLVRWMYLGHLEQYGFDPLWRIRAVEHEAMIWLPLPSGRPSRFRLKMKIDLIVNVLDMEDEPLWLVDHKSGRDLPTDREMELDDQFGLYTLGMRDLGRRIQGAIYSASRTQRNKGPMHLEDRFKRYMHYRTDKELDRIALEATATAKSLYGLWDEGEAPRHPNPDTCFPAETLFGARQVELGMRRFYSGSMVRVAWDGNQLTGTPNHPVLTRRGWVALELLVPGDEVVEYRPRERRDSDIYVQDRPTSAAQQFETWAKQGVILNRERGAVVDFHGDGREGDVDVVPVFSELLNRRESRLQQPASEDDLFRREITHQVLATKSRLDRVRTLQMSTSVLENVSSSLNRDFGRAQSIGLRERTNLDSAFSQTGTDCGPTNAEMLGEGELRLPGQITFHKVISVDRFPFTGHVYNLQTLVGWYTANHTVVRNCRWRCSFTEACLAGRKGMDERQQLLDRGFQQNFERH